MKDSPGQARQARRPVRLLEALEWPYHNLLRVPYLCIFPVLAVTLSAALYVGTSQGQDFLRILLSRLGEHSGNQITSSTNLCALLAHLLLGLSAWHPARWLLSRDFADFPLDFKHTRRVRSLLPRLLGATPLVATGLGFFRLASNGGAESIEAYTMGAAYAVLGVVLFLFLGDRPASVATRLRLSPESGVLVQHMPLQARLAVAWSFAGFVFLTVLLVAWPVSLPRVLGAVALTLISLAAMSMVGGYALTYWPLSRGLTTRPLVALALLAFSVFNDNHDMRVATDYAAHPQGVMHDVRPTPTAFYADWKARQPRCRKLPVPGARTPMVLVAVAGGGIRAAYWTAAVLHEIRLGMANDPAFDCALFALSGVSGGSLGVTAYVAREYGATGWRDPTTTDPGTPLGDDFLSPAAGGLFFTDLLQRFLPTPVHVLDRSRALEAAWERAFAWTGDDTMGGSLGAFYAARPGAPTLLLNATSVADGKRAVHSNLDLTELPDLYDLGNPAWTTATVPVVGAVHNSARFTLVSPAGLVRDRQTNARVLQVVDGGYFENSGAATLTDLLLALADHLDEVEPIVLLLSNDVDEPALCENRGDHRCHVLPPISPGPPSELASEIAAPLHAIFATRDARGREAEFEMAQRAEDVPRDVFDNFLHRVYFIGLGTSLPTPDPREAKAYREEPLGWALSPTARQTMAVRAHNVVLSLLPDLRASLYLPATPTATAGGTP